MLLVLEIDETGIIYLRFESIPRSFLTKKAEKYKIHAMVFKQLNTIPVVGLRLQSPQSHLIPAGPDG